MSEHKFSGEIEQPCSVYKLSHLQVASATMIDREERKSLLFTQTAGPIILSWTPVVDACGIVRICPLLLVQVLTLLHQSEARINLVVKCVVALLGSHEEPIIVTW